MSLILLIVKQFRTKTAHRFQTNDSVRRRPPTNNSKCPWKCAIENLAKAFIKENQTHVKNLLSKIAIVLPATRIQDGYMISKLKGTSLSNTLSKIMSSNTNYIHQSTNVDMNNSPPPLRVLEIYARRWIL